MKYIKKAVLSLVFPLLLVGVSYFVTSKSDAFTPQLKLAVQYVPYLLFLIAMLLGWWFNRSRIFFISLVLGLSQLILTWGGPKGVDKAFFSNAVFTLVSVFLPLNVLLFSATADRGVVSAWGKRRLYFILAQILMVAWVIWYNDVDMIQLLNMDIVKLQDKLFASFSQLSLIAFLLTFIYLFFKLARTGNNLFSLFNSILIVAFSALTFRQETLALPVFFTALGVLLDKEVVQVSYNMAYLDELTSLPSRRALKEQMMRLSGKYAAAMIDIDHFKRFNDTYGHDVGDQVLKLVGSCIKSVGGGGKFFRYGGEEFTILFPGKNADEALPFLEQLREQIAARTFIIRGKNRPKKKPKDTAPKEEPQKQLAVTVSIGVAEKTERLKSADDVIKAADKALYNAKESGRNRICR